MKYIYTFSLCTLFMLVSFSSLATTICDKSYSIDIEKYTVNLLDEEISYIKISSENMKMNKIPSDILGPETSVFIGFNEHGHVYLSTNKYRYESDIFFAKSNRKKTNLVDAGLVIEIPDESGEIARGLNNYLAMMKGERYISCAQGVCDLLRSHAKIDLKKNLSLIYPARLFREIIKNKALFPQIRLSVIGDMGLKQIYNEIVNIGAIGTILSFTPLALFVHSKRLKP